MLNLRTNEHKDRHTQTVISVKHMQIVMVYTTQKSVRPYLICYVNNHLNYKYIKCRTHVERLTAT